ncbi:MAG TPA: tetratricopeptide repeat protein, partial [Oscillatoriaceae cyanobacterium]
VVLAFSNAHQADPAWREWLEYLHRNGAKLPVLVLSTSIGEPEVDFDPSRSTVELPAWSARESHLACCATLGQADLPEIFTEQVHTLSAGYPTRLETLLRRLAETGKLQRRQGLWQLPEEPVEALVRQLDPAWAREQGLKRLSPLALALFEALLVVGREIELFLLWQVVRTPKGSGRLYPELGSQEEGQELFGALQELEEGGWVQAGQGRCALAAEQDHDALLATIAPLRRLQLHGAIASALETLLAQTPDDPTLVSELAHHALAAGDKRRGPRYALTAAQQHARLLALEPAEALLREGLALIEGDATIDSKLACDLHQLRANVARLAGDRRLAGQAYEKAMALAMRLGDVDALAAIGNGLGRLYLAMGQYDDASLQFEGVLARLEASPTHAEAAQALTRLGQLALARGDLSEARQWLERALAAARQGAYRALIRENTAQLGYLYVATGEERAAEGLGLLFEAIQLIEKDEAKLELNACYALLGNAQLLLGRFSEAKLAFQRNCDLCAEIGAAPHDEASALMRRATVELELGDYSGARRSASPAGALARMVGNKMLLAQVRLIEGIAALYQGDFTIYQDAAAWVDDSLATNDSDYLRAMWHTYRAEAEGYLGDWSAALSSAGRALTAIGAGEGHEFLTRTQLLKGEALTRLGLYKPARQALDEVGNPRSEAMSARLLLARAQLERLDGNPADARVLGGKAIELARRAGVVPVAAACAMLLARVAASREDALTWSRRALIDAETCNQPALEAEALYQAACSVRNQAQAELFFAAAEEAWRRAIAGLTTATLEAFGNTEERTPLKKLISARAAEGERLPPKDQALLLEVLTLQPTPETLLPAVLKLCRELTQAERVALCFRREGQPVYVAEHGPVYAGAASAATEFAMASAGPPHVWLHPFEDSEDGAPFAQLLIVGMPMEQAERLGRMVPHLRGALWAAWRFWLSSFELERRVPQAPAVELPAFPQAPGALGAG